MSPFNETIMAYARDPVNRYAMENPTVVHTEENRSCGDTVTVYLSIRPDHTIGEFSFDGRTAIFTTASVSMLGERLIDVSIENILSMTFEDVRLFIGDITPRRRQASTLGLLAVRNAIHKYLGDSRTDDWSDIFV